MDDPMHTLRAEHASLVAQVEGFNGILKKLICDFALRFPEDARIARLKKRVALAVDIDPVSAIDPVGTYLYMYRDQIYSGDDRFFVENDYDAEMGQGVNAEKVDLVAYIIPRVKEAWAAVASPAERAAYTAAVQALLDHYLDYLALKLGGL